MTGDAGQSSTVYDDMARNLHLYIVTFNCGRALIDEDAFAAELFNGLTRPTLPDILVLSLQEIAPLSPAFIGGTSLLPYWQKFHGAVQVAARLLDDDIKAPGKAYGAVRVQNIGMTGIMVFAKEESTIKDVEFAGVGLGVANMGNKSAVGIRLKYSDGSGSEIPTELTFVAAHLAPHEYALERRNEDWKNVVRRLIFLSDARTRRKELNRSVSSEDRPLLSISSKYATIYKPTSYLFFAGDLNYRTSVISPSPTDHIDSFPQPYHEPSSPQYFVNFFENDQLNQERLAGRTCHGLTEAEVKFPPTYKYDPEYESSDDQKWYWAKHRWPSWCDRVLYRSKNVSMLNYSALPTLKTSDHRPVALELSVPLAEPVEEFEDDPQFGIDINWKTKQERGRQFELIVGYTLYLTSTAEGAIFLVGIVTGLVGAYFGIKALLWQNGE